jgi:hypothetical protein
MPEGADDLAKRLDGVSDPNTRARLALATILPRFAARGHELTVVGGSAIALWDPTAHVSHDIDLVGAVLPDELDDVLTGELGFERIGRHWLRRDLRLAVEVPAWVLEPLGAATASIDGIAVISLEDLVLDRVEGWHATGAFESWRQAARLLGHPLLDPGYLEQRSVSLGLADVLTVIRDMAAHDAAGSPVDPPLSHAVHSAFERGGLPAARRLLRSA